MAQQAMGLNIDSLRQLKSQITDIDVQLDAVNGGTTGKRSLQNSLVGQADAISTELATPVIEALNDYEGTEKIGAFYGVIDKIETALSEEIDEALEALYESSKTEVPELSEEEISALTDQRKKLSDAFKTLKEALSMFGNEEAEQIEDPKIRRGRTSRGPTVWGKFQYAINGEELPETANNLRFVGQRAGLKVSEVKTYMEEAGIDVKNPPREWTVELPNSVVMTAVALEQYADDFTEDDDE